MTVAPTESTVARVFPCSLPSTFSPPVVPEIRLFVNVMSDVLPPPVPPPMVTSWRGTLARVNCWPNPSPAGFGPANVWPLNSFPSITNPLIVAPNSVVRPPSPLATISFPRTVAPEWLPWK